MSAVRSPRMFTSMQQPPKGTSRNEYAVERFVFLGVPVACAIALLSPVVMPAANAQQPQFPQGISRPGRGPTDPNEMAAYSAAVNEPDTGARISALQQFLLDYPESNLRQAAVRQLAMAKQQDLNAAPQAHLPVNRPTPSQPAMAPVPVSAPAMTSSAVPDSPLQHPPKAAEITIANHTLTIKAYNSTLSQILQSIASSTGMKIEGLSTGQDQRFFGTYGPGDPHAVLLDLLQGSGYNVLMLGDTAGGAPRELSLSQRTVSASLASGPGRANSGEEDSEDTDQEVQQVPQPEPPPPPVAVQPNPGENQQPRSPQEILQELQRLRQQNQQGQQPQ